MTDKIKVLDHGFILLHNMAGPTRRIYEETDEGLTVERDFDADDTDPANSARMSFNQMDAGRTREQDFKLAEYLMKNQHWTPFESIEVWIEMKLPIFVARQFVRHRTASLNEVSGRYVTLPEEWYIPENVGAAPKDKKQGQAEGLDDILQKQFKYDLDKQCGISYNLYLHHIAQGVAPEHARMFLHLNHYTHWLWKQDLRNLLDFLRLRDHGHAQIEAQMYAKAIDAAIRQYLPETMKLYDNYVRMQ
jgi:thymidylate synthase (FAD)